MFNKKFKNNFSLIFIILIALAFQSCKSTRSITREAFSPEAPDDATLLVAKELSFPECDDNCKFIFFRLYNPIYKNPLYIANILKGGIGSTRVGNVPEVSHASINFDLEDDFYGLSLGEEHELKVEECGNVESNSYMTNCDPEKSEQITYALKVSEEEYNRTKEFVERYAERTDVHYAPMDNFSIAAFSVKRKFFTSKEKKKFGNLTYPSRAKNKLVTREEEEEEKNFVCSTFVGYTLYNNVDAVYTFFNEHNIKYEYLNVADISEIPGVIPLFYSTWADYLEAARAFVEEYPQFKEYLKE